MQIFRINSYASTGSFYKSQMLNNTKVAFGGSNDMPPASVIVTRNAKGIKMSLSGLVVHGSLCNTSRLPSKDEEFSLIQAALGSSFINERMAKKLMEESDNGKIMHGRKLTCIEKPYSSDEYTLYYGCVHGNSANTAKIDRKGNIVMTSFARGLF